MKVAVSKLFKIGVLVSILAQTSLASAQGAETDGSSETASVDTASEVDAAEGEELSAPSNEQSGAGPAGNSGESPEASPVELDGETYQVRLRDLEQRVDELKEQIRRSHTRLSLLSDTILAGASGGGRAEVVFNNDLSGAWHVVEAVFVLDGAVQYKKTDDTGVLAKQRTIPIFSGSVPTGDHTLQVMLKLRGHGFGVFSYLRGIEATVRSSHSFTLSDGKVMELKAIAWEKGGPTTPVEQQPDIRFTTNVRSMSEMPKAQPAQKAQPAKSTQPTKSTVPAAAGKSGVVAQPGDAQTVKVGAGVQPAAATGKE